MSPRTSSLTVALITLLALRGGPAAAEDRGAITATTNFAIGSSSVGDVAGFLAPGGHFDVGFRVRAWRLAAELDTALWSTQGRPDDAPETGSFVRGGVALRWHALDVGPPPREGRRHVAFRIYVEGGVGRQRVDAPGIATARNDVMLGLGVAPEFPLGRILLGVNFGLRVLIARAPDDDVLARTGCPTCAAGAGHDLTLLYTFGFAVGR